MNRIESSDDRWKSFARPLENSLGNGVNPQGFVDGLNLFYETGQLLIGKISGKTKPTDVSQCLHTP